jgi:hypothetical protein
MMEKARESRFQSIMELAHALEDLRGHAAAYEAARARRAESGHSGHTLVARAPDAPPDQPTSEGRPTLRVDVGAVAPVHHAADAAVSPPTAAHEIAPARPQVTATSFFDLRGPCTALVVDPRSTAFSRTLMLRPPGLWFELAEVCNTAQIAPPASIAMDLGMFVTWVEHPYPDPSLAAVVFLSLRSGWSTVVLCPRVR